MKRLILTVFAALSFTTSSAQDPVVQALLSDVEVDSLIYFASAISGEFAVNVNGNTETIASRNKNNPGNAIAADYIEQKFNEYGLSPAIQTFGAVGENVLGTKTGLLYPNQKVVICGHYDSMPTGAISPAADDDGSGTAALIEAARVISQYDFAYTIVFAAWDEEEYGLVGANYYASQASASGDSIIGVVNMDAIAWDGDGDGLARIHTRPIANSLNLATIAESMNSEYSIGLNLAVNNPGATYSDHAAFWNNDYSAILIIEDFDNDGNPHYHTTTDRVEFFDTLYFEKLAKLSFATAATIAIPYSDNVGVAEQEESDILIYPNPVREILTISRIPLLSGPMDLQLFDPTGRLVHQIVLKSETVQLDMKGLVEGNYLLQVNDQKRQLYISKWILKE